MYGPHPSGNLAVMVTYPPSCPDSEFLAHYLNYVVRTLDRFEFFAVDRHGIERSHSFSSGYVPLTLSLRELSDKTVTVGARADQALADCDRALVRGVAGSGKSALLRWLAVQVARGQRDPVDVPAGAVPYLVELNRFSDGKIPELAKLLPAALTEQMPEGWATRMLDTGRALLLLDGLDEVPPRARKGVENYVSELLGAHPRMRCVVTTRPSAVAEQWWADRGFQRFDLLPMSRHSVEEYVHGWHQIARDDYPSDTEMGAQTREQLESRERDLLETLANRPALRGMATSPLLCGLLCALHLLHYGHLPEARKEVYDKAVELLLLRGKNRSALLDDDGSDPPPTEVELETEEELKILQQLAYSMVRNREQFLSRESAQPRVGEYMRGLRNAGKDPVRVLENLVVRSGLLRDQRDRSLQFVHRTFRDHLAAKEVLAAGDLNLLLQNADKDHWHDVAVMAGAHARPAEVERILTTLLDRGQAERQHRDTLYLLAAAILEQVSVLPPDNASSIREQVREAIAELIPPKSISAADQLAQAGPFVLDLLPGPEELTPEQAALVVRTVAGIATKWDPPGAVEKILRFTATRSEKVLTQLIEAWGRCADYEYYARTVLAEVDFRGFLVDLQSDRRVDHIGHLTSITDLRLRNNVTNLAPLTELPELRYLAIENNDHVNLRKLVGCETLRTLRLDQCSSVASREPIDLSPLLRLRVDELIICGLLTKVDWSSLGDWDGTLTGRHPDPPNRGGRRAPDPSR